MTPASVRYLKALCVGGVAILVAIACGNPTPQSSNLASNQALTFPILADFGTLDPAVSDAETDQEIQQNMFDGLVKFDNNLNVVPDIAASMPTVSSDGKTYTFKLRTDVTFSNGDKVTSKDVLYSWNSSAAMQGAYATNLSAIEGYDKVSKTTASGAALEALLEKNDPSVTLTGLTAPDASTVMVKLANPAGWFLPAIALSGSTGEIVDVNAVKQDFDNWWTNPATAIGTGPFKMTSRVPKQSVDFAAVSNWWGSPKPTLTKVHLDVSVTDPSTAITKYEQGGYDVYGYGGYSNMPVADIKRIQATSNESSQLLLQPKVRSYWVSFNMVHDAKRPAAGPFLLANGQSAHDLRMAFALAVDKAKLVTVGCPDSGCSTGYDTKAYDDLLDKADTETGDQANADYKALAQMLINDVVYIPLYYSKGAFLFKPYVKGAGTNNFSDFHWNEIQILSHSSDREDGARTLRA